MAEAKAKPEHFFLVIFDDDADDPPHVYSADSAKTLSDLIAEHVLNAGQPLYAFAFKGQRIPIGLPTSICTINVGDEPVVVGDKSTRFDDSGRIVPLKNSDK